MSSSSSDAITNHKHRVISLRRPKLAQGEDYHTVARSHLKENVLKDIAKTHRLTLCPLCGEILTNEPLCALGAKIDFSWNLNKQQGGCASCVVVWEIELSNYTDE